MRTSIFSRGISLAVSLSLTFLRWLRKSAARVANALGLRKGHVVTDAVFRLAGGETLQESGTAIFKAIEDGTIEFWWIGNGNLSDKRGAVSCKESLRHGLLLDALPLRRGAEDVHVAAAEHRRGVRVLPTGVRVDLRVQHHSFDVRSILENDLGGVLIPDIPHAAVAAHGPDLGELENLLIAHQGIVEVR